MSPPANADSPGLVPAVLAGDPVALDVWYRAEHAPVYRLCFGLLGGEAEADDAAQDAMLHLLDRLHAWDRARPYRAWRNTVVLNLCRDRMRRGAARRGAERAAAEQLLPARLPDPEEAASNAEVRRALAASLSALSPREREAFVLRDLQGCSTAEAAQAMSVAPGTVRSVLTLARRRLRALLSERLPELAAGEGAGHG